RRWSGRRWSGADWSATATVPPALTPPPATPEASTDAVIAAALEPAPPAAGQEEPSTAETPTVTVDGPATDSIGEDAGAGF
ncbi:hypothetical protein G9H71_21120, partial [Motilibacter sp. E257]